MLPARGERDSRGAADCEEGAEAAEIERMAAVEPTPGSRKAELVYRKSWRTRDEAENDLFAYIDG
ncbi:hypothetical protein ACQPZA_23570 [Pseudonocardia xinjiangensis]|uniref:hypothetical protein n=1 Tax=Pseudonocardia xinjiangensis TaxID=75289 RepID=UPI003D8BF556